MSFLKGIIPPALVPKYLKSEWSFAQVRGIEGKSLCAFDKTSSKIYIISSDGTYTMCAIEEGARETGARDGGGAGGECVRLSTTKFLRSDDEMARGNWVSQDGEVGTTGGGTTVEGNS